MSGSAPDHAGNVPHRTSSVRWGIVAVFNCFLLLASLSRDLATDASVPRLLHLLHEQNNSVLSLSADERHIYSGSQCEDISVSVTNPLICRCVHTFAQGLVQKDIQTRQHIEGTHRKYSVS